MNGYTKNVMPVIDQITLPTILFASYLYREIKLRIFIYVAQICKHVRLLRPVYYLKCICNILKRYVDVDVVQILVLSLFDVTLSALYCF